MQTHPPTTQLNTETGAGFDVSEPRPGLLRAWAPPRSCPTDRVVVGPEGVTLGRGPMATWQVADRRLSGLHARFWCEASEEDCALWVQDLGSTNGVFVDGVRLGSAPRPLGAGQVVRCGSCILVVAGDVASLEEALPEEAKAVGWVGRFHSPAIVREVRRGVATRQHVLLSGESGVGKELAAKLVARYRAALGLGDGHLVSHNCARFATEEEATSTLFGIRSGVFTGVVARTGLLEQAREGVLFLDEIHALPVRVQQSLLRFVEDQQFSRVGEERQRNLSVGLVFATNLTLQMACDQGFLAPDLVSRLIAVEIPPLGARRADVPELFSHVLRQGLREAGIPPERLAGALHPDQLEAICLLPFGMRNVRELVQLAKLLVAAVTVEGKAPRQALGTLLVERYPDNPVVQRMRRSRRGGGRPNAAAVSSPSRALDASGRRGTGSGAASGQGEAAPAAPATREAQSHYEQHRGLILRTYQACRGNLSATERALKKEGITVSRRWLRVYLKRWGVR